MELNWAEILKAALIFGVPVLVVGLWIRYRLKAREENDATSEALRTKSR